MSWDVAVVGAGHNGLVAAARLARAGRKVVVLERDAAPGGLAAGFEFHPGFRSAGALHDTGAFRPAIARALGLERHGLAFRPEAPAVLLPAAGEGVLLRRDGGGLDGAVGRGVTAWRAFVDRVAPALARLLDRPAPPLDPRGVGELWEVARRGLGLRRLGARDLRELLRVAPMPVADWLRETIPDGPVAEGLAAPAVLGTWLGPHSAGSAWNLLADEAVRRRPAAGGAPALVAALVDACRTAGVELRLASAVERVLVAGGRAAGVRLAGGEELAARCVVATCDPRRALLGLLDPAALPFDAARRARNVRCRGTVARLHLALAAPLAFGGHVAEWSRLGGGSLDDLERAFDAVKYRRLSERPFLEVFQPSVAEPGWAPPGQHVASVVVAYAPYALDGGWGEAARAALREGTLTALARHDPEAREKLLAVEVLTPADLEARHGVTGGHLHHGEHALDQLLFMRPIPEAARSATPLPGFYLGGSGCHPGGGLTGVPGWLAAGAVLRA